MLKQYLRQNNISIYQLAKKSSVPYSTVNDLVNHKLTVENLKSGQLYALSEVLEITMDELYGLCLYQKTIHSTKYPASGTITIRHKTYYLSFMRNNRYYEDAIIPVKQEASSYIDTLAEWKLDEILDALEMEDAYETLSAQKI